MKSKENGNSHVDMSIEESIDKILTVAEKMQLLKEELKALETEYKNLHSIIYNSDANLVKLPNKIIEIQRTVNTRESKSYKLIADSLYASTIQELKNRILLVKPAVAKILTEIKEEIQKQYSEIVKQNTKLTETPTVNLSITYADKTTYNVKL